MMAPSVHKSSSGPIIYHMMKHSSAVISRVSPASVVGRVACSKKRVQFATTPPDVYCSPQFDEEFKEDYWWQPCDLKNFQTKTKRFIDSASGQVEVMESLNQIYKLASRVACKVNDKNLSKVLQTFPVDANLMVWCCGYPVRGLENYLRDHNFNSHIDYQSAILTWQTAVSDEEELRMVSQYMTRESRIFARMLGQGDSLFSEMPDQITTCLNGKTTTLTKKHFTSSKRQVVSKLA